MVTTVLIDISLSAVIRSCGYNGSHWYHTLCCHQKLWSQRFSLISHSQLSSEAVVTTILIDITLSTVIRSCGYNGSHWHHTLSCHQKLWSQRFSLISHSQLSSEAVVTTVHWHHTLSCYLKLLLQRFSLISHSLLSSEAVVTTILIDITLSAVIRSCGHNDSHWYHTLSCHQKLWLQRFSLTSHSQLSSEAVVTTVLIDITLSAVIWSCGYNGSHWYHTLSCHQKLWLQRFSLISHSQLSSEAVVTTVLIDITLSVVIRSCGYNGSHWYHTLSCHQKLWLQRFSLISHFQLSSEAMVSTVFIDITLSVVIRSCGHNGSHWYHSLSCHQKLWSLRFSLTSYSQLSPEAVVTTVLIDIILSAVIRSCGHNGSHWYHTLSCHQKLRSQRFSLISHSQLSSEAVVTTVLIDITLSAVIWSRGHNGSHWYHTLSCHLKLWLQRFSLYHTLSCHQKLWLQRFSLIFHSQLSSEAVVTTVLIDITLSAVIMSCGYNGSHWYHTLSCHQKLWLQRFSLISHSELSSEVVVTTILIDITLSAVIRSCGHNGSHWHHTLSCHLKLWLQRFSLISHSQLSSEAVGTTVLIDIILSAVIWSCGYNGSQWYHTLSCHLKLLLLRFSLISLSQLSSEAVVKTVLNDITLSAVIRSCSYYGSHWYHSLSCHQKLWLQRFIDIILSAVIWSCCYNGSHWYHTLSCHQKLWLQRFIDIILSAVIWSCCYNGSHWYHTLSCHQKLWLQRFSLISHSQ